jgi:hypothetical protein
MLDFILGTVAFLFVVLVAGHIGWLAGLLLLVFAVSSCISDAIIFCIWSRVGVSRYTAR